jgi:hypothetical protein
MKQATAEYCYGCVQRPKALVLGKHLFEEAGAHRIERHGQVPRREACHE